ncbi:MAG: hypothetical protein IPK19_12560 [Chloroflexi bacterium]|nr:hypothetical protein [Chloroflexota bacterium]
MTPENQTAFYCSECSRAAGESLAGTAAHADVWMLLEYDGAWGAKTPEDSQLSPTLKKHIGNWLQNIPNAKFTFIRQREDVDPGREQIRLFVARSLEITPELYRIDLSSYDELLDLDLAGVALGAPEAVEYLTDERLFAVCTNGRRDISCAKYGAPVYDALRAQLGATVWQTTHIGGHRFAATLVSFPDGVVYGYIDPDDVSRLIMTRDEDRVWIEKMRGRTCYSEVAQAADIFLRQARGIRDLPGVRYVQSQHVEPGLWDIQFETFATGMLSTVRVAQEMTPFEVYKDSDGSGAPIPQFRLVDIH